MNLIEEKRLEYLKTNKGNFEEYFVDYYGLSFPFSQDASEDFETCRTLFRRRHKSFRQDLEMFFQDQRILPKKWMAAQLGMTVESMDQVIQNLWKIGMRSQRYCFYKEFICKTLRDDLIDHLEKIRFKTNDNHNDFCNGLHDSLNNKLGIKIQGLYCDAANHLNKTDFAYDYDCITCLPLGPNQQVWLDFGKPIYMCPDRCSKLYYKQNRETLRIFNRHNELEDTEIL